MWQPIRRAGAGSDPGAAGAPQSTILADVPNGALGLRWPRAANWLLFTPSWDYWLYALILVMCSFDGAGVLI